MIIFKQYGWLGNQIFQYCALRSIMKDSETLIMAGCHQFDQLFLDKNAVLVNQSTSQIKRSVLKKCIRFAEVCAKKGYIQTLYENEEQEMIFKKGVFNHLTFTDFLFQQTETAFNPDYFFDLKIRPKFEKKAKDIIDAVKKPKFPLYFIHVRRGAYLTWKSEDYPAVLPLSYYRHCIQLIREHQDNPQFIICTDDKPYAEKHFSDLEDIFISKENYETDFALMRHCDGGILSASSFSWWAAYYVHHQIKESPLYAPLYWINHRKKSWYPKNIRSTFLTYIDVHKVGYSDD